MDDLSSTTGAVAIVAIAVAVVALAVAVVCAVKLRRMRLEQTLVLGPAGQQDVIAHAAALHEAFDQLNAWVQDVADRLDERLEVAERRLDGTLAARGLVRYDAYNEMSGRQSTTIALLDASKSGILLSSIHHRDQARLYAKQVHAGRGELELSPEEEEAIRIAETGPPPAPPEPPPDAA